jgi:hypothetical protein
MIAEVVARLRAEKPNGETDCVAECAATANAEHADRRYYGRSSIAAANG